MGCFTLLLYAIAGKKGVLIAISSALLILSHNILAMLFIPVAFFCAYITSPLLMVYVFLGIGLTNWFWLPALYERQFVLGLNSVDFRDHFLTLIQLLIPSWGPDFPEMGMSLIRCRFRSGYFHSLLSVGVFLYGLKTECANG